MDNITGRFGHFDLNTPATYIITDRSMQVPWEYIYQNRDVLLRVDQFGPVNAQAYPPQDIMLFKRERDDKFSKWLYWLQCDEINGGTPFTNFWGPSLGSPDQQPDATRITYTPWNAVYEYTVGPLTMKTTLFVPRAGCDIVMTLALSSTKPLNIKVTQAFSAYINPAALAPWDKPEWYLRCAFGREEQLAFWGQLFNPGSVKEKRRVASLWATREGATSYEMSQEYFIGQGDLSNPQGAYAAPLRLTDKDCKGWGETTPTNEIIGYPPIFAARYDINLAAGKDHTLRQVLSLQPLGEDFLLPKRAVAKQTARYFDAPTYQAALAEQVAYFNDLCSHRTIKTADPFFDYYMNTWMPVQMYWVSSLDRGWPTGMRGSRDCANDFMGEVYFDGDWAKQIVELGCSCQRADGWFPRQISTAGRTGTHDLRPFSDGGAFMLEFFHEYFCVTGDTALLDKKLPWLDDETESTVYDHMIRALDYYTNADNIGEHGLCKIRGGDWLDAVNRAGLQGRGESVMVTNQVIIDIGFVLKIADFAGKSVPNREQYTKAAEAFQKALLTHAFNKKGFFNSVFTDRGEWVFSDNDPDGETRPYVCANAWSVISGVAGRERWDTIYKAMQTLKCESGYRLFYPGIGEKPIELVGRSGSGDGPIGFFENATPYNHGSHGFLGRSFSVMGKGEDLLDVLLYLMPYDQDRHPTSEALAPPYAVVNCWQRVAMFMNRGGMTFLTGTIAMGLRMAYQWMLGLYFDTDALVINPCLDTKTLGEVTVNCPVRDKNVTVTYKPGAGVTLNGAAITTTSVDPASGRTQYHIAYNMLKGDDQIIVGTQG